MRFIRLISLLFISYLLLQFVSCSKPVSYLEYALEASGRNRIEIEAVLEHYRDNPEKLAAAQFLIENMPAHMSYQGSEIDRYYDIAYNVLQSELTPVQQRDSLLNLSLGRFYGLDQNTVTDLRTVSAEFLIHSIDQAFEQWKGRPWTSHLNFDQFCEWILPYKVVELQNLDYWRDTLANAFEPCIEHMVRDDDQYGTVFYTVDAVRNGILDRIHPVGMYNRSGYPMLRSDLLLKQTYGRCEDYVNLAVMTYRSLGLPAVIDETPFWGRYRAGHVWYVILSDRGEELSSEWDIGSVPGSSFFPDKRIPKVFRRTYAINRDRAYYRINSQCKYPFDLCQKDVTDKYFNTSDIEIPILENVELAEDFVYIATFTGYGNEWSIVDLGMLKNGKACFSRMGRNVLYLSYGYDGENLIPISLPFILHTDGTIEYISFDWNKRKDVVVRRKYYQSNNVAKMRKRLLGGQIQCSMTPDFKDPVTLYTIDDLNIPDKIPVSADRPYRYWRYMSPAGSYGSIAELAFFDADTVMMRGKPVSSTSDGGAIARAFDNDWLSNFETDQADGNWIGMDMGTPHSVAYVRIVPRSDDNDIHPGDEYELRYWDGHFGWVPSERKVAVDNTLSFNGIPEGALMWLHDYTRGMDERPFLIDGDGNVVWW
ncbi:MAG: discoidin domain-containing protein [Bacteroidaceae bacterium]|nr:discoidin domain-containing protein [Bacteroidaceae bacterium]